MLSIVESALWLTLPWEACLTTGLLLGWVLPAVIGKCDRVQRGVAFMVLGVLIGVGTPAFIGLPEIWTFPLFTLGCWLAARGAFGLNGGGRWNPGTGLWHRLSQGIWCLGVSCALVYGASHYGSLQAVTGLTQTMAYIFAGGAVLFFALALAACLSKETADAAASPGARLATAALGAVLPAAGYPADDPTLPSTISPIPSLSNRSLVPPRLSDHARVYPVEPIEPIGPIGLPRPSWHPAAGGALSRGGYDGGYESWRAAGFRASSARPPARPLDGATRTGEHESADVAPWLLPPLPALPWWGLD